MNSFGILFPANQYTGNIECRPVSLDYELSKQTAFFFGFRGSKYSTLAHMSSDIR